MAGYVSSWIEQYTGAPTGCGIPVQQQTTEESKCLLYVLVAVVFLSIAFEKKRKNPTK